MKVLYNNEIKDKTTINIDVEDRGYQFGDGVYEVINIYDGIAFTLDEHIERLYRSAKEISLVVPYTKHLLKENILQLIMANRQKSGGVYVQITRGTAARKHHYNKQIKPILIAYPLPYNDVTKAQQDGVKAIIAEDLRWLRCDIKSLNLLYNIMVKQQAHNNEAFEAILIRDNIVTEGSSSNIFIIKEATIFTHPANNFILNGITRQRLLQIFNEKNWSYVETTFSKDELLNADEVFLTSTTNEVIPITIINQTQIGDGKRGSFTSDIQRAFKEKVVEETKGS